jgi:hypothetical protein
VFCGAVWTDRAALPIWFVGSILGQSGLDPGILCQDAQRYAAGLVRVVYLFPVGSAAMRPWIHDTMAMFGWEDFLLRLTTN